MPSFSVRATAVRCIAFASIVLAQSSQELSSFSIISTDIPTTAFTGSEFPYSSYTGQETVQTSGPISQDAVTESSSGARSEVTATTTPSPSVIEINGHTFSISNGTISQTVTSTTSSAAPSNTVPCNNYPEFCDRKYSNITEVCAHNSAFAKKHNAASNQVLGIIDQLNDGVRMLQGETHLVNGTIYNCHTDCNLLNVGTFQDELSLITSWIEEHPYDVVTILIVNSNFADGVTVADYVAPIQDSGIAPYLYEPAFVPQHLDQWPTLGEMILTGKRVVMFMDYNANQTAVPYVLDEFSHMWETPFSPTDDSFPCNQQRPPNLNQTVARDQYMYIANHNLNVAIDVSAILGNGGKDEILIPDTARINRTNGSPDQYGMLGAMNANCTQQWGRPPNFLLVDYYNDGDPAPGSVFEVAARANNVIYNRDCCGTADSAGTPGPRPVLAGLYYVALGLAGVWIFLL